MSTPEIAAVLARVRAYRKAAELSYSSFALSAGLSRAALNGMDRDDWSPTSDTLKGIEAIIPPGWREGDPVPPKPPNGEAQQEQAA